MNEGHVYQKLVGKRRKVKAKDKLSNLVRTADLKKTFWSLDTSYWSYKIVIKKRY